MRLIQIRCLIHHLKSYFVFSWGRVLSTITFPTPSCWNLTRPERLRSSERTADGLLSNRSGSYIVLEGPDGGGKTTQAARLATWLRLLGQEVVSCRDPGGTALGEYLRALLKDRSEFTIGMMSEMLLFMASRAQLVAEVIRPALERGAVVIGDRYLLSNVVYQGVAGGIDVDDLWLIGKAATGGLMPDLTVVIDVPIEVTLERVGPGRDRIEDRGMAYRERVREGFLQASASYPSPIIVVDGSLRPDEVTALIQTEVARALAIASRP